MGDPSESLEPQAAEVPQQPSVADILKSLGGPDEVQIESWKSKHGEVFVTAFSDKEIYIWRTIRRQEYRELQIQLAENKLDQMGYEDAVASKCVLWPSTTQEQFSSGKGGTSSSLAEQIMQSSNFLNPQQAAAMILKL